MSDIALESWEGSATYGRLPMLQFHQGCIKCLEVHVTSSNISYESSLERVVPGRAYVLRMFN